MAFEDVFGYFFANPLAAPAAIIVVAECYCLFFMLYRESDHWSVLDDKIKAIISVILAGSMTFLIFFPMLDSLFYSITEIHADLTYLLYISAVYLGFLTFCLFLCRLLSRSKGRVGTYFGWILLASSYLSVIALAWIIIINLTLPLYQIYSPSVFPYAETYWSGFGHELVLSAGSPLVIYYLLENPGGDGQSRLSSILKQDNDKKTLEYLKTFLHRGIFKSAIAIFLIVLAISFSAVPLDIQFTLFTPKLTSSQATIYPSSSCQPSSNSLRPFGRLVVLRKYNGAYDFYRLYEKEYSIQMQNVRVENLLYILNPSTSSVIYTETPQLAGQFDWLTMWAKGTPGISFQPLPSYNGVSAIQVDLTDVSNSTAQFTLYYWQQNNSENITVSERNSTTSVGNGWYLARFSYIFTNFEKTCIVIPRMAIAPLDALGANSTSAVVWVNGTLGFQQSVDHGTFYPWATADPGHSTNVTVTFLTTNS